MIALEKQFQKHYMKTAMVINYWEKIFVWSLYHYLPINSPFDHLLSNVVPVSYF